MLPDSDAVVHLPFRDRQRHDRLAVTVSSQAWTAGGLSRRFWEVGNDGYVSCGQLSNAGGGVHPLYLHRQVWAFHHPDTPVPAAGGEVMVVDHINRKRWDCRISNLRLCTRSENARNRGKAKRKRPSTSQYKGVWRKRKRLPDGTLVDRQCLKPWVSEVSVKGSRKQVKHHATEKAAGEHYNAEAKRIHGEYACLNVISPD